MLAFWTLAGLAAALSGLLVMARARRAASDAPDDLAVERTAAAAELAELDRLKTRGQIAEDDWAAARAEAGRRILKRAGEEAVPSVAVRAPRLLPIAVGGAVLAGLGVYFVVGQPGFPDQPYERRVAEWASSPQTLEPAQIAAVVAAAVEERPGDAQGLKMLGAARFEAGDPLGAASAFRRALAIEPGDAQSWARLGESLTRANGGEVGGDAEAAFVRALELDPDQLGARYFLGEAALARGDAERVRQMWGPLVAALSPDDPRRQDLESRLPGAAR